MAGAVSLVMVWCVDVYFFMKIYQLYPLGQKFANELHYLESLDRVAVMYQRLGFDPCLLLVGRGLMQHLGDFAHLLLRQGRLLVCGHR